MIKIIKYSPKYKKTLEQFMEGLQGYLVSVDTFKILKVTENYGKKYVINLFKIVKKQHGIILLAQSDNKIIGCVVGVLSKIPLGESLGHKKRLKNGRVLELYVEPEFRGQHIGALLIEAMEKHFKTKKCALIRIEVYAPNTRAHEFYKQQGYQNESIDLVKQL